MYKRDVVYKLNNIYKKYYKTWSKHLDFKIRLSEIFMNRVEKFTLLKQQNETKLSEVLEKDRICAISENKCKVKKHVCSYVILYVILQ